MRKYRLRWAAVALVLVLAEVSSATREPSLDDIGALFDEGAEHLQAGRQDEALKVLKQIADISEQYPKYVKMIGAVAFVCAENPSLRDHAPEYYKRAITLNPRQQSLYRGDLATVYAETGQWDQALEEGKRAVQLKPTDALNLLNLAQYYLHAGDAVKAEATVRRAMKAAEPQGDSETARRAQQQLTLLASGSTKTLALKRHGLGQSPAASTEQIVVVREPIDGIDVDHVLSISEALNEGRRREQAGDSPGAARFYQAILDTVPGQEEAAQRLKELK